MKQLNELDIDNIKLYEDIVDNKKYKNEHCDFCDTKIDCNLCEFGGRGLMNMAKNQIFDRYKIYYDNKKTLNKIERVSLLNKDQIIAIKSSYKNSVIFKDAKKRILDNIPNNAKGICPFCMISEPNTFDHYFPESIYPEYILFTHNLVPCCSYCNTLKGDLLFDEFKKERKFIHFYFDDLPQTDYLKAKFWIEENIPRIEFYFDNIEDDEIFNIIVNHFESLKLFERYYERINEILSTVCKTIELSLDNGIPLDVCADLLKCKAKSFENNFGKNYWKTCVYNAMAQNKQELFKLLKK